MIVKKKKNRRSSCSTPFINLSSVEITLNDLGQLKLSLAYIVSLAEARTLRSIQQLTLNPLLIKLRIILITINRKILMSFDVHMQTYLPKMFTQQNITHKNLKRIITDPNLVAFSGNKESRVVIMNKIGYQNNLQEIV